MRDNRYTITKLQRSQSMSSHLWAIAFIYDNVDDMLYKFYKDFTYVAVAKVNLRTMQRWYSGELSPIKNIPPCEFFKYLIKYRNISDE